MELFLKILLFGCSLFIIFLVLMQDGESNGLSGFTGKNDLKLFENTKERGSKKLLSQITAALIVIFFLIVIVFRFI